MVETSKIVCLVMLIPAKLDIPEMMDVAYPKLDESNRINSSGGEHPWPVVIGAMIPATTVKVEIFTACVNQVIGDTYSDIHIKSRRIYKLRGFL